MKNIILLQFWLQTEWFDKFLHDLRQLNRGGQVQRGVQTAEQ